MKKTIYAILLFGVLSSPFSFGQNIVPIAFDFATPVDVSLDADGNAWVTETGSGADDGRIQKVLPDGTKETIIENLPSFFDVMSQELQGALSTQALPDGRIFVCQGEGVDALSATILEFHIDDFLAKGAPLVPGDQRSAIEHGEWVEANGFAESNPYSFILDGDGNFIISDAAANAVIKYTTATGQFEVLAEFPPFENPSPVGPPFVDAVPTKILAHPDGGYLVSTLTGFPFLEGAAKIYHLQNDGSMSVYASGLTLLTDMAFDPNDGELVVLQFASFGPVDTTFGFIFNSARLLKIHETGGVDTLAEGFGPSAGLALSDDGSAYLTHLFLGQLLKSDPISSGVFGSGEMEAVPMAVFPNPSDGRFEVEVDLKRGGELRYLLMDMFGRESGHGTIGHLPAGENQVPLDFSENEMGHGAYQLSLFTEREFFVAKIILR